MYLLTVLAIWTVAAMTPGPNFLLVTRCALASGVRVAVGAVAGTILGTMLWGTAGWLGLTSLFLVAPWAFLALKVAGGLYLCVLGARMLWQARRAPEAQVDAPALPRRALTPRGAFRAALATNLANPKTALFVASLFAAAMPAEGLWWQGLSIVLLMGAISSLWYAIVVWSLTRERIGRAYLAARRKIDTATGAIFLVFGIGLLSTR